MFGSDQPTPFDIRFRLAGIPVRISPWFWIVMALIGSWTYTRGGPLYLVVFVACGFVSIMVHELGHAVLIRLFGSPVEISLIAFGGLARPLYAQRSTTKRILIALAGPAAGFVLAGLLLDLESANEYVVAALQYLFFMNLVWGLFNLLPIWPLDGGQVCRELFVLGRARHPDAAVHLTSIGVAGTMAAIGALSLFGIGFPGIEGGIAKAIIGFISHSPMLTVWMALFAFTNYQMLQAVRRRGYYYEDDDTPPWRRR